MKGFHSACKTVSRATISTVCLADTFRECFCGVLIRSKQTRKTLPQIELSWSAMRRSDLLELNQEHFPRSIWTDRLEGGSHVLQYTRNFSRDGFRLPDFTLCQSGFLGTSSNYSSRFTLMFDGSCNRLLLQRFNEILFSFNVNSSIESFVCPGAVSSGHCDLDKTMWLSGSLVISWAEKIQSSNRDLDVETLKDERDAYAFVNQG